MKLKSLFFLLIPLFLITFIHLDAGNGEQLKITGIKVNENFITEESWNNLKINTGDLIAFEFNAENEDDLKTTYRIFLNGKIINPGQGLINNSISFSNLAEGVYILKVQSSNNGDVEMSPIVYHFIVESGLPSPAIAGEESEFNIKEYITVETIGGLCILQFIIIIVLFIKRKLAVTAKEREQLNEAITELSDYKYSHKRLKEEIENHIDENNYLKKQLKELDLHIKDLEKSNIKLLEQKEHLAQSKHQLEELQEQKEDLFAMAIHDIKNPASVIRSAVELLKSYDLNATDQQELMTSIMASSENLVQLSQEMCTIIAKHKPEPALKFQKGSIKSIIDDVCLHNMSYAKAKQIKLLNKSSASTPEVLMDAVKIEEAIDNLINNAIKYGPPDTIVEVTSYVKNEKIVVEVKDNGNGLTEEDIKRAFQKGAMLSNKPTGVEQSSGLGLWLIKKIMDEHKGKAWVESKQGKGSTFGIELPLNSQLE